MHPTAALHGGGRRAHMHPAAMAAAPTPPAALPSHLQVHKHAARHVLAGAGLGEEGVEGVVAAADGLVGGHLAIGLDAAGGQGRPRRAGNMGRASCGGQLGAGRAMAGVGAAMAGLGAGGRQAGGGMAGGGRAAAHPCSRQ